jgi:hypothetical protein
MLRKAKDVMDFTLGARDGEIGRVKDFYFDEKSWTVRYLVADTGKWLELRRVLISTFAIRGFRDGDHLVEVDLTKDQITNSPSIEEHAPVSRQYELEYYNYYGWPYYWRGPALWGASARPAYRYYPAPSPDASPLAMPEHSNDPNLRSTEEVMGYHIQAQDGEIGHVADFLIEDEDWVIRYLVVDTRNWWPGKHVLLPPAWATALDWDRSKVHVDLDRETIKGAPHYDLSHWMSREYETKLFDYYGRPPYWEQRLAA